MIGTNQQTSKIEQGMKFKNSNEDDYCKGKHKPTKNREKPGHKSYQFVQA